MADFERKLVTIMFTDIVDYSAKMSKDEQCALNLLEFYENVSDEVVRSMNGRVIKKMGDGMLVIFNSVSEALDAARLLQNKIRDRNAITEDQERLLVRIGIHAGDVLIKDGDIFGNGVNVAARLQHLAVPGGICLSEAAYAMSGSAAKSELVEVRNVSLKNIAETYTVFQMPSVYPDEYPIAHIEQPFNSDIDFVITAMRKIPPEKFSLPDAVLFSVLLILFFDFVVAVIVSLGDQISLWQAVTEMFSEVWLFVHNLFFIAFFTVFILRDAVEIKFRDVRGADKMISYVIRQFGFKPPVSKKGEIIFRPTLYNLLMWQTQKMRVAINGNTIAISGSFIFLRKVKKMLKPYLKQED